ncbi:MAG: hypothetical protein ABSG17_03505 [Spirochaetia bacterium]|jgi:hypothetical protein
MKQALLLLAVVAALAACNPPPFDLTVSLSARSASKMTLLGQVGPVNDVGTDAAQQTFYPQLDSSGGMSVLAGFVTSVNHSANVNLIAWGGSQYQKYGNGISWTAYLGSYPAWLISPTKLPSSLLAVNFNSDPTMTIGMFLTGSPSTGTLSGTSVFLSAGPAADFSLNASCQVVGISVSADPSPTVDKSYWLIQDTGGTDLYVEAEYDVSPTGFGTGTRLWSAALDLSALLPGSPPRVFYYFDPASKYGFASWYDTGSSSWQCAKWTGASGIASGQALPGIMYPVTALLTTGELLSIYQETGRVYDQNGNLLAQFPLTGIRFIGEKYVNGTAELLFSQALDYNHQLQFNVYGIPAANLKSLAQ